MFEKGFATTNYHDKVQKFTAQLNLLPHFPADGAFATLLEQFTSTGGKSRIIHEINQVVEKYPGHDELVNAASDLIVAITEWSQDQVTESGFDYSRVQLQKRVKSFIRSAYFNQI